MTTYINVWCILTSLLPSSGPVFCIHCPSFCCVVLNACRMSSIRRSKCCKSSVNSVFSALKPHKHRSSLHECLADNILIIFLDLSSGIKQMYFTAIWSITLEISSTSKTTSTSYWPLGPLVLKFMDIHMQTCRQVPPSPPPPPKKN